MKINKFLPFITKKSSPIYIYDTLLSRSKGIDRNTTNSLFYSILKFGIDKIREHAKTLPSMTGVTLYTELVSKFYPQRIDEKVLSVFVAMANSLEEQNDKWDAELSKFDIKDIMCFFLVMAMLDKEKDMTSLNFRGLLKYKEVLEDLPKHITLSNNGTSVVFDTEENLKIFILYMAIFEEDDKALFNVSLKPAPKSAPEGDNNDVPF